MKEESEVVPLTREGLWLSVTAEVALRFRHCLALWGKQQLAGEGAADGNKEVAVSFVCRFGDLARRTTANRGNAGSFISVFGDRGRG